MVATTTFPNGLRGKKCRHPGCNGDIYMDDGEAKCFSCGRGFDPPPPTPAEGPESEGRPKGTERVKRKYAKKVHPQDSGSGVKAAPAPFEQGASSLCIGCPAKAELQRLRIIYEGYRLAIADLGGHSG